MDGWHGSTDVDRVLLLQCFDLLLLFSCCLLGKLQCSRSIARNFWEPAGRGRRVPGGGRPRARSSRSRQIDRLCRCFAAETERGLDRGRWPAAISSSAINSGRPAVFSFHMRLIQALPWRAVPRAASYFYHTYGDDGHRRGGAVVGACMHRYDLLHISS